MQLAPKSGEFAYHPSGRHCPLPATEYWKQVSDLVVGLRGLRLSTLPPDHPHEDDAEFEQAP